MGVIKKASESETLVSFVDGLLGLIPVGGEMISQAVHSWVEKNKAIAREILLTSIRQGDIDAVHKDELLSMLYRFYRSVQEGSAKKNLILLAKLISGIGMSDKETATAETFIQYAPILESLNYLEIALLGKIIKENGIKPTMNLIDSKFMYENDLLQSLQSKGLLSSKSILVGPEEGPSDIKIIYKYSENLKHILNEYGNIWEDIAKKDI